MNKYMKMFCVRNFLFAFLTGLLGQILLPCELYSSTGVTSSPTGPGLVKEQLAHKVSPASSTKPMNVYVIQKGDVFCDILVKAGVSRKDALYISKKALQIYKLTKMRPGSELEFYFSQDGTALQEINYTPSSRKKVVLYNGRVISLVQAKVTCRFHSNKTSRGKTESPAQEQPGPCQGIYTSNNTCCLSKDQEHNENVLIL